MQRSRPTTATTSQLVAVYPYRDEHGKLQYEVERWEPGRNGKHKSFRPRRKKKGSGRYVYQLGSRRRIPYRLQELVEARDAGKRVYLVEGEKDADTLAERGYVASCHRSASGVFQKDWIEFFQGVGSVVVIADKDDVGRTNAKRAYHFLKNTCRVRVLECNGGKDITEHLDNGGTLAKGQFNDVTVAISTKITSNGSSQPNEKESGWTAAQCAQWGKDYLYRDVQDGHKHNGREAVAYKFALQLRDVPRAVAEQAMRLFVEDCPDEDSEGNHKPYGLDQAMDTLRSALDGEAPAGWKPGVFSAAPAAAGHFRIQMMDELEMRDVTWLWDQYIPFGKLTSVEGDPETGKSLFTLDLSARVSCGGKLPDGAPAPACCVLLICDEDDYEDTIGPRLQAAGADRSKVGAVFVEKDESGTIVPFYIPDDLDFIRGAIDALKIRTEMSECLVVVDPVTSYLSEQVNSHNEASVRRVTSPLAEMARETNAAFVMVRHLNKNSSETNPKYRGGGSIAFYAAARAALQFGTHPQDESLLVMAQAKKNLALSRPSLSYRVIASPTNARQPVIAWEGSVDLDARTMLRGPDAREDSPDRDHAVIIIDSLLVDSGTDPRSVPARVAVEACRAELGISRQTAQRAAKKMGLVVERKRADDGTIKEWIWREPTAQGSSKVQIQGKV